MKLLFGLILILVFQSVALYDVQNVIGTHEIKDFKLTRCIGTDGDPINLENVTITIGNEVKPVVTGVFSTEIDLYPPLKVSTLLERKIFFWIVMPCVNNMGTCTFNDICKYSRPVGEACPAVFKNLPCRCPVKKGTYQIPPRISNVFKESVIFSGEYKGTINIFSNGTRLACYDTSFKIYDA
ncbi:hypothetical protein Trydic_g15398 [Trypoxylus dichotomus]